MKGYRFVEDDLRSKHGGVQWRIGEWKKQEGPLELCVNGFHACRQPLDSLKYNFGSRWFRIEARGKILKGDDKFCAEQMRLISEIPKKVLVQFAVDCAKRVLPTFQKKYPDDKRPKKAIIAVEKWLKNPTEENRQKCEAAWAAAGAAWAAAWAAWAAAGAAWAAAWAAGAAWAARAAERKWQNNHLKQLIKKEA